LPARFVLFDDPFSPDGRRLASAGGTRKNEKEPGEVKLWDLTTGQDVYTLGSHASVIYGVAYSPCGRSLEVARARHRRDQRCLLADAAAFGDGSLQFLQALLDTL